MAVTVTSNDLEGVVSAPAGARRIFVGKVTFDATYPAGGETVLPSQVGLNQIDFITVNGTLTGQVCTPIKQTDGSYKLKLWEEVGGTQEADVDQSAVTVEILAIGR